VPVTFMPIVDGALHDRHGTNAMFYGEAGLSVAAAVLFGVVVLASGRLLKRSVPHHAEPEIRLQEVRLQIGSDSRRASEPPQ
jgi:hypothetical protein